MPEAAAVFIGGVGPFTLIVIRPVNDALLHGRHAGSEMLLTR